MTLKNSLTFTKLTAVVFVSISVIFGVKYFDIQGKNKKLKENFVLDKKTYSNDLNEIFNRYDNEVLKNKKLSSIKVSSKPEVAKNESGLPKINEIIVFKPINNSNLVAKVDSLKNVVKIQSN